MMMSSDDLLRSFDVHDAEWCPLLNEKQSSTEQISGRDTNYLAQIRRARLLSEPPDRLSLYGVAFDPGFYIPTHYHDVDQFLLVIDGEFRVGQHRLHPGHGAFMPAGNPYNVTVGRAGGRFLEFREIPAYRTAFNPKEAHIPGPNTPTEIPGWSRPVGKKGKTVFFDAETCAGAACPGFGPGDTSTAPPMVASAVRYQPLHLLAGGGYSMIGIAIDSALDIPLHQQDADKIVYVLSGEMKMEGEQTPPLRPGAGMFVPAKTPTRLAVGPAGVKFLEFRKQSSWRTEWLATKH